MLLTNMILPIYGEFYGANMNNEEGPKKTGTTKETDRNNTER